jgi:hypothetical protein
LLHDSQWMKTFHCLCMYEYMYCFQCKTDVPLCFDSGQFDNNYLICVNQYPGRESAILLFVLSEILLKQSSKDQWSVFVIWILWYKGCNINYWNEEKKVLHVILVFQPNVVVQWLTLIFCIWEVPGSILGPGDRLSWLKVFMVFLSPFRWMLGE